MKELSIEEKAKAYDKALAHAKLLLKIIGNATFGNLVLKNEFENMFHELAESEDERIKNEIIAFVEQSIHRCGGTPIPQEQENKWIAWLKKQGEQKSIAKYKVGDTIYYNSFGRLVSFVIANIVEDGTNNPMYEDKDGNSVFQNDIVEQNPAWSDEDEKMYTATIFALAGFMGNEDKLDWLKSLKDRVQPKQEWSEEDEKHYQGCLNLMKLSLDTKPYPYYNDYLWLKSLRPQSTWKPSNEQMLAIDTAINVLGKGTLNGKQLIELQEQLKKLREE